MFIRLLTIKSFSLKPGSFLKSGIFGIFSIKIILNHKFFYCQIFQKVKSVKIIPVFCPHFKNLKQKNSRVKLTKLSHQFIVNHEPLHSAGNFGRNLENKFGIFRHFSLDFDRVFHAQALGNCQRKC